MVIEQEVWQKMRRVLVVRLDNIGDMAMMSAPLRELRAHIPHAEFTLFCTAAGAKVAPLLPWIDKTIVKSVLWQDTKSAFAVDPARELALVDEIKAHDFDAAFIFTSFSQSAHPPAFVCYLAGIAVRVGQSKEFGGGVLSHWVKSISDAAHQTTRSLHLLEAVGVPIKNRALELVLPDKAKRDADNSLRAIGIHETDEFIALAPGATCAARRYDIERYAEAVEILIEEIGLPVVLIGSAREHEFAAPILARNAGNRVFSLVGDSSVAEMSAIIARARLVICNDSGSMHLADAFARPQVVLYSGTELESQWQPRRSPAVLLRRPTLCSPCHRFLCPYAMQCLDIPAREVAENAVKLLEQTAPHTASNFAVDLSARANLSKVQCA